MARGFRLEGERAKKLKAGKWGIRKLGSGLGL
jgi:hypothetical protein